jgi:hypothetical protein
MTIYHKHHIIPKHMGGSDDPSNLIEITIEEHANIHKQLWEDLGHWQDKIAWQMLSGQISSAEAIKQAQSEGAKNRKKRFGKDNHFYGRKHTNETKNAIRNKKMGSVPPNKGLTGKDNPQSKIYIVIDPKGNAFIVKGLADFCRKNNLTYQVMGQVALGKFKHHKKYKCRRLS